MRRVSDEEVEFILRDFTSLGIVLEDLRYSLLDHMCCIIENEMKDSDDFHRFYESVLPRFFNDELAEIQTETDNLLKFKNYYSMQKTLQIIGGMTALFTILGAAFKSLHLPGAGAMIITGGFLFCFIFMPLLIVLKFKDEEAKVDKWVFSLGLLMGIFMLVGVLFKLMHWPGATLLMLTGTLAFTFLYVPIYFITKVKRPELKFNTIINSVLMMACGGIVFALFDLSYSKKYSDQMLDEHRFLHNQSERLFSVNDESFLNEGASAEAKILHEETIKVDAQIEALVSRMDANVKINELRSEIDKLKSAVNIYNFKLSAIKYDGFQKINNVALEDLHRLNDKLAIIVLARLQQEIAINESVFLAASDTHSTAAL